MLLSLYIDDTLLTNMDKLPNSSRGMDPIHATIRHSGLLPVIMEGSTLSNTLKHGLHVCHLNFNSNQARKMAEAAVTNHVVASTIQASFLDLRNRRVLKEASEKSLPSRLLYILAMTCGK